MLTWIVNAYITREEKYKLEDDEIVVGINNHKKNNSKKKTNSKKNRIESQNSNMAKKTRISSSIKKNHIKHLKIKLYV